MTLDTYQITICFILTPARLLTETFLLRELMSVTRVITREEQVSYFPPPSHHRDIPTDGFCTGRDFCQHDVSETQVASSGRERGFELHLVKHPLISRTMKTMGQ